MSRHFLHSHRNRPHQTQLDLIISALGNDKSDPSAPVADVMIPTRFLAEENLDHVGQDG